MSQHGGVVIDPRSFSESALKEAKGQIIKGGSLDVVVRPAPATLTEADEILRKLYAFAPLRPRDLNFTVLFDTHLHEDAWDGAFNSDLRAGEAPSSVVSGSSDNTENNLKSYDCVAVGGTWDHLHWGHRVLLTLAAYAARSTVVIGVTGSALLKNKQFASVLENYDTRAKAAADFICYLRPELRVLPAEMLNMFGPTIEMEDIHALVVSKETSSGGKLVNEEREKLHWSPLAIIEAGLIPSGTGGAKLSSTDIRREQLSEESKTKI